MLAIVTKVFSRIKCNASFQQLPNFNFERRRLRLLLSFPTLAWPFISFILQLCLPTLATSFWVIFLLPLLTLLPSSSTFTLSFAHNSVSPPSPPFNNSSSGINFSKHFLFIGCLCFNFSNWPKTSNTPECFANSMSLPGTKERFRTIVDKQRHRFASESQ